LGDASSFVEHAHVRRDLEHEGNIVLDQQDPYSIGLNLADH
jgi:hypothetical protein